jgi:hypothetical protein
MKLTKKKSIYITALHHRCSDNDGRISFDELQLTFYRNVNDLSATTAGGIYTGGEPNTFFRIVEFLTFDEERKGYVLEDDCMGTWIRQSGCC